MSTRILCCVEWENRTTNQICNDFSLVASMMPCHCTTTAQCLSVLLLFALLVHSLVAHSFSLQFCCCCFFSAVCVCVQLCPLCSPKFLHCHDETTKHFAISGKYIKKNAHFAHIHRNRTDTHCIYESECIYSFYGIRAREICTKIHYKYDFLKESKWFSVLLFPVCLCRLFPLFTWCFRILWRFRWDFLCIFCVFFFAGLDFFHLSRMLVAFQIVRLISWDFYAIFCWVFLPLFWFIFLVILHLFISPFTALPTSRISSHTGFPFFFAHTSMHFLQEIQNKAKFLS